MPSLDIDIIDRIKQIINALSRQQEDILTQKIQLSIKLGYTKMNIKPGVSTSNTELQKAAIQELTTKNMGYISEFNQALGEQLTTKVKTMLAEGKNNTEIREEMKSYIVDVFGDRETVLIDRRGQTRTVIEVDANGGLHRVEKPITQKYQATVGTYADMLSRTAVHQAYERGRVEGYRNSGFIKWRFVGPVDPPRVRPDHARLVGGVFEYGTPGSDMALDALGAPNCRHRSVVFFDNEKLDTPDSFFEKQKEKAGLKYNSQIQEWVYG